MVINVPKTRLEEMYCFRSSLKSNLAIDTDEYNSNVAIIARTLNQAVILENCPRSLFVRSLAKIGNVIKLIPFMRKLEIVYYVPAFITLLFII